MSELTLTLIILAAAVVAPAAFAYVAKYERPEDCYGAASLALVFAYLAFLGLDENIPALLAGAVIDLVLAVGILRARIPH